MTAGVFAPGPRAGIRAPIRIAGVDTVVWAPAEGWDSTLVFCHGFLGAPDDYAGVLAHVASHGIRVIAPRGHRRSPSVLTGRFTAADEAERVRAVVASLDAPWVAGHSRGGQVAWLLAAATRVSGIVVIDPVDGEGRQGAAATATARRASWLAPTTVIGASLGGRCAPVHRNHERFATAAPPGATHLVVEMGHADLLEGRMRTFGRLLCPGVDDPLPIPRTIAGLVVAAMRGTELPEAPATITEV